MFSFFGSNSNNGANGNSSSTITTNSITTSTVQSSHSNVTSNNISSGNKSPSSNQGANESKSFEDSDSNSSTEAQDLRRQLNEAHNQIINLQNVIANSLSSENSQDKIQDLEGKLSLCKRELHDAVTKFRNMISDITKARDNEKTTNLTIMNKLESLRKDMQDQSKHHDMEKAIWMQKYEQIQRACNDKEIVIESLKAKLRDHEDQRAQEFVAVLNSHHAHKESSSKELQHVILELDRMTKSRDDLTSQLNSSRETITRLEKIIQNLTSKYDDSNRNLIGAKRELDGAMSSIRSTSELNEQLKGQLLTTRARLDEANQEVSSLNRIVHDIREQQELLRREVASHQRSSGEATESYQLQIGSLEDQMGRLREEIQRLRGEKAALSQDLVQIKADLAIERETVNKAETARDAASASAASAAHQIEGLVRAQQMKDEDHRIERDALLRKVESVMGDLNATKEEVSAINRRFDKALADKNMETANMMTVHAAQNEAHKQEMSHIKDAFTRLQSLHDKAEVDLGHLRELDIASKATISQLELSVSQARQRGDDLSRQYQDLNNEVAGLRAVNQSLTGELTRFREECNKLRSTAGDMERELKSLQALKNLSTQQLEQRCRDLQKQLDVANGNTRELQSKQVASKEALTVLQGELEQNKLLVVRLEGEIGKLEYEQGEALKLVSELRTQVTTTVKSSSTHTHTRQKLPQSVHEKIDNLNKQLKSLHNLSMAIQDEMVPEELIEVVHNSQQSHEETSSVQCSTVVSSMSTHVKTNNDVNSLFKLF